MDEGRKKQKQTDRHTESYKSYAVMLNRKSGILYFVIIIGRVCRRMVNALRMIGIRKR